MNKSHPVKTCLVHLEPTALLEYIIITTLGPGLTLQSAGLSCQRTRVQTPAEAEKNLKRHIEVRLYILFLSFVSISCMFQICLDFMHESFAFITESDLLNFLSVSFNYFRNNMRYMFIETWFSLFHNAHFVQILKQGTPTRATQPDPTSIQALHLILLVYRPYT